MGLTKAVLLLTLTVLALSGIIPLNDFSKTPNPNDIFQQVQFLPLQPFNALAYATPFVTIDLTLLTTGYHGLAYSQVKALYPQYSPYPVSRCAYSTLGLLRFYNFHFTLDAATTEEANTTIQTSAPVDATPSSNAHQTQDQLDGFEQVSVSWAQQDPTISIALNNVITSNWEQIRGNPLNACWSRPVQGVYNYRFYFQNVTGRFQYNQNSTAANTTSETYFANVAPVFTVSTSDSPASQYQNITLAKFKSNPAYPAILAELTKQLGRFDQNWIINFQVAIINETDCYKVVLNFQPFLLKQNYEAYYYGSIQKAALLKIDEEVFNANGQSFQNWQNIDHFNQYSAFHNANDYVLSQFTWLRFYQVTAAYSALHLTGRVVRLVYSGIAANNIDPSNQINIVVFIDANGCYYINTNDFLATSTLSYGRNNWVSLFVDTPNVTKAQYYTEIVHFFQSIYPKFWSANTLVDIKFKDNLHVIEFQNPTNIYHAVLNVDDKNTQLLNKLNWTVLNDSSPLLANLQNYVASRFNVSKIMFVQYININNGTHFQVSYLDANNKYNAAYVLYIPATNVFTNDNTYSYAPQTYSNDPLPTDIKGSIGSYLSFGDTSLIALVSYVSLSPNSFAVIALGDTGRWQITLSWASQQWRTVSKQPYSDGYNKVQGYPSSLIASSTGFLTRLYPNYFNQNYLYASIETKTVGVSLYTRNVYSFGSQFVEAVVQSTYGVENSQVLNQWLPINVLRQENDYGYGTAYNYNYNVDSSLLYNGLENQPSKSHLSSEPAPAQHNTQNAPEDCPNGTRREFFTNHCVVVFG